MYIIIQKKISVATCISHLLNWRCSRSAIMLSFYKSSVTCDLLLWIWLIKDSVGRKGEWEMESECRLFDSDMNAVFQTGPLTHFLSSSQLWHINNETGWGQGFENKLVIIIWRVQSFFGTFLKVLRETKRDICFCCNSHSLLWGGVLQSRLKLKLVFYESFNRGRPIIGADIKHFTDYRYRPFSKQICRFFLLVNK